MYDQVGDPAKIEQWQRIFASVKRRLLHGAPHSSLPDGETKEELTIMEHVRRFIERFKNPNFVGFKIEQARTTNSPAPGNTASNTSEQSSAPQAAPQPVQAVPAPAAPAATPAIAQTTPAGPVKEVPKVESPSQQPPAPANVKTESEGQPARSEDA
jgi:hypothetical protein